MISLGGSGTVAVINPFTLGAGDYILEISGDVVGLAGGNYVGVMNISPVPEAGEWVMLVFGLGLVGFFAASPRIKSGLLPA